MNNSLNLNLSSPTDIKQYHGRVVSFVKLQLSGIGKISSCTLRFFNNNDKPWQAATIKLARPEFTSAQTLLPQGDGILIMDYDYCQICDITGFVYEGDQLILTLTEPKMAISH